MEHSPGLIKLSLLGPWQLHHPDASPTKEPRRKEQGLLAYLAVEANLPHSRDALVGLFWPELPAADARNNLRVALSRLKRYLGGSELLETTRNTVAFTPTDQFWLDVGHFLACIKQSEAHAHPTLSGCQACRTSLKQALELYRGEFLAGFFLEECLAFEEWLFVWRERLHVQALKQLEQLADAAAQSGHLVEAAGYARRQIELDPLHESAHRQLMRALYAQRQRSAALNQFQTCQAILQAELGVEPETETVLLRQEIQADTLEMAPSEAGASGAVRPAPRRYALPESTTPFIGREAELDQLSRRLAERTSRLISLVGPGGIGKTRLAIQAAHAQKETFRDGVFFVPLDGAPTAAEIPAAVAEALGVTFRASAESPQTEIKQILRDKQLLLIMDNLEHVIDGGAELLLDMLQSAPEVVLLVTSREQLNAQAEDLFRLRGLPYPATDNDPDAARYAAVRLFADRAHRLDKTFGLSKATLGDVVQICRLVEGLPLGLELAATWVRDVSVNQIAASLVKDFDLLETDFRDISPRHRNIAAVFEHSWTLLTPAEQAVLPQLAVFRSGFTLAAAQNVTETSPLVLTRLRYKSFLRGSGDGRYTMHELLRQLALRKLKAQPAAAAQTQTRHSHYFLSLLQGEANRLKGEAAAQTGAALRLEIDNIRQGWRWAVETSAWEQLRQSATGLVAFFVHEGLDFEGVQLLQIAINALATQTETRPDLLPFLLVKQLSLRNTINTFDEIMVSIERALTLTQSNPTLADLEAEIYLIWSLNHLDFVSNPKQARVYLDRAFALAKAIDDPEFEAWLYCESGRNYLYDGQFDQAVAVLEKALAIFESLGHLPGQALVYSRLAPAYAEAYNLGPALICDRRALSLYTQINNQAKLGDAHNNLAETYVLLGAYEQAREHTLKSLGFYRQQGYKTYEANTLSLYALVMDRLGQTDVAEKQYRASIALQKALKVNFSLRYSLLYWGDFQLRAGRLAEAELTLDEAITLNVDLPHMRLTSQAKQAKVYLAQGQREAALALADAVWREIEPTGGAGLPLPLDTLDECCSVFHACEDDRARAVLQLATNILKRTATEIDDPDMRASFLNNVPVNRRLQATLSATG
ncbi:MAG: tetratricopeptide repeat protein [Anaerolineae bacterium]|nr:tetratricopeptide repeat protein [Anaerolineae bacterium]